MTPPDVHQSTTKERLDYVLEQWKCLGHCPSCGKCHILKGRDEKDLYADYIRGVRTYQEITQEIKK